MEMNKSEIEISKINAIIYIRVHVCSIKFNLIKTSLKKTSKMSVQIIKSNNTKSNKIGHFNTIKLQYYSKFNQLIAITFITSSVNYVLIIVAKFINLFNLLSLKQTFIFENFAIQFFVVCESFFVTPVAFLAYCLWIY